MSDQINLVPDGAFVRLMNKNFVMADVFLQKNGTTLQAMVEQECDVCNLTFLIYEESLIFIKADRPKELAERYVRLAWPWVKDYFLSPTS
jgi:hypothetical protein